MNWGESRFKEIYGSINWHFESEFLAISVPGCSSLRLLVSKKVFSKLLSEE